MRAWALLLEFIESSALCHNAEVALAALKSFQEILQINKDISPDDAKSDEWKMLFNRHKPGEGSATTDADPAETDEPAAGAVDDMPLWSNAWRVWRSIGTAVTTAPEVSVAGENRPVTVSYVPSQAFLTALIQTFPALYAHIKSQFVAAELQKLFVVLQRALCVPVHSSATPFIVPVSSGMSGGGEMALTPLQDAVLGAIKVLCKVGYYLHNTF